MTDFLNNLDQSFSLWLNGLHSPAWDTAMIFASSRPVWIPLYILLIVFLIRRMGPKRALLLLAAIGLTAAFSNILSDIVKDSAGRLRPCYNTAMLEGGLHILEKRGGLFGFFSAHAANHFGIAVCMITCFSSDRKCERALLGVFIVLWAFTVSISRVFVGKHFFGDILAGAAIGCILGWIIGLAASRLMNRLQ